MREICEAILKDVEAVNNANKMNNWIAIEELKQLLKGDKN